MLDVGMHLSVPAKSQTRVNMQQKIHSCHCCRWAQAGSSSDSTKRCLELSLPRSSLQIAKRLQIMPESFAVALSNDKIII